jgi:glutamate N-acetyltransferase/amino-acid N-acetyltransferase
MARRTAESLGLPDDRQVLVASTGIIGRPLPMAKIQQAIPAAVAALDRRGGDAAAQAILTTDTVPKSCAIEVALSGGRVRVGGMAKGAGMIRPRLVPPQATMLAFLTTDARVEAAILREMLKRAADLSFNSITVDGETSTNDTVLLLANGASGVGASAPKDRGALTGGIEQVCRELAQAIVRDGEGATKFITVRVRGAADDGEARRAAFAVADSNLVKTALFGNDPNWGRILSAAGACGAALRPEAVRVTLNGVEAFGGGRAHLKGREALASGLRGREVQIELDLGVGDGRATVWTSDLSYEYVRINAEYHT